MAGNFTYSFLDVVASIQGPGGGFSIGAGAGVAEEGISVEPTEEFDRMTIGADGGGFHSLGADKSGKVTVRLLKTSPVNAQLQTMLAFQRASAATHGVNTITIASKLAGDAITAQQVGFAKQPAVSYTKDGEMLTWEFNAIILDIALGAGVQA